MALEFKVGDHAEASKAFTREEVSQFAEISLDKNPLHLDEEYAKNIGFDRCIVHGALVASLFSGLLGQELPGPGTIYLGQDIKFLRPVFIGERVTASVEIIHIRGDKPILTLNLKCSNSSGENVIEGEAVVKV